MRGDRVRELTDADVADSRRHWGGGGSARMQTSRQWRRRQGLTLLVWAVACGQPDRDAVFDSSTPTPGPGSAAVDADSGGPSVEASSGGGSDGAVDDDTGAAVKLDVAADQTGGPALDDPEGCKTQLDVVFVMDVSTSMTGLFDALEQDILDVDLALAQLDVEADTHYGLVVFVDDTEVANDGAAYLDAGVLADEFAAWNEFTGSNLQIHHPGRNGTLEENSLDSLYRAASEFQWRSAATTHRIVIHTTDATFWDGPLVQPDGVAVEHGYAETVARLRAEEVRVFAFASDAVGPAIPGFPALDAAAGWFAPYDAMPAIPEDTGGAALPIDDVLAGTVSLADAIPQVVEQSQCEPYPPAG